MELDFVTHGGHIVVATPGRLESAYVLEKKKKREKDQPNAAFLMCSMKKLKQFDVKELEVCDVMTDS